MMQCCQYAATVISLNWKQKINVCACVRKHQRGKDKGPDGHMRALALARYNGVKSLARDLATSSLGLAAAAAAA
eukprot:CAMPEP_0178441960 /NCGR_PEP_ID=MMETSP0689_2-20121128/37848_1 /TAXON_ID=160604 /ORGANISM="Amphidinium massartii, Strain CS-259" /LENGTH=73 /DNA_ID=CAMNT_0020065351 /DNA_START=3 /DNA_END=221 /DNA_ORIENTATION=+